MEEKKKSQLTKYGEDKQETLLNTLKDLAQKSGTSQVSLSISEEEIFFYAGKDREKAERVHKESESSKRRRKRKNINYIFVQIGMLLSKIKNINIIKI